MGEHPSCTPSLVSPWCSARWFLPWQVHLFIQCLLSTWCVPHSVVGPECKRAPDLLRAQGPRGGGLETHTLDRGESHTRCHPHQGSKTLQPQASVGPLSLPHSGALPVFCHSLLKSLPQIPVLSPGLTKTHGIPGRQIPGPSSSQYFWGVFYHLFSGSTETLVFC